MKTTAIAIIVRVFLTGALLLNEGTISAQSHPDRLVRLAELSIDPAQLDAYKASLREEIETSIRIEPGVLTLYAVTVKDHPNEVRLFEMYASASAYQAHLQSEHFKKYKSATAGMVKSLRLIETEPLLLGTK